MAFKVSKSQALQLFMYVRQLTFTFDPFASEARSIRETWRQMTSPRLVAANPKCKVDVKLVRDAAPAVEIEFVDGSSRALDAPAGRPAADLVAELYSSAHALSLTYAETNKKPPN